jgi:RND family efflux transporter MFP subunit
MKSKLVITAVVLLLFAATAAKLIANKEAVDQKIYRPDPQQKMLVQATTILPGSFSQKLVYMGTFAPNREVMIMPQIQGEVTGVYFQEGDYVQQGKVLARLNDDLLQAQLMAAEANFETAYKNLERYTNASHSGGVSQLQVDNAQLNLKTADSQVRQLKKQIELCRITAPFSGMITLRNVEIGSVIGGQPIGQITDISQLKLEVFVPEKDVALFTEGQKMKIEAGTNSGQTVTGKVEYIADRADAAHNYMVRIMVKNNPTFQIKAGMYGTASLDHHRPGDVLLIPRSALLGSAKSPEVFVIEGGVACLKTIQIGSSNDTLIEIVKGLNAGDVVITSGHINLTHNTPVQVSE